MTILHVAIDIPSAKLFEYIFDGESHADLSGRLILVPFGRKIKLGVVIKHSLKSSLPTEKLKVADRVLMEIPPLPSSWLRLCFFCAQYYHCPLGQVIGMALPGGLENFLKKSIGCEEQKAACQERMLNSLEGPVRPNQIATDCISLSSEQEEAVAAILASSEYGVFALFGITGSGKTEVYFRSMDAVLMSGQQVLFLVPEISLVPQMKKRLSQYFRGKNIVVIHSGLSVKTRKEAFFSVLKDEVDIVLGTRSALFSPLSRLGMIIVDEEHDASYKQQEGVRFSARDLAIYEAKKQQIRIILGSATPSLETLYHCFKNDYSLIKLTKRALLAPLPEICCLDTKGNFLEEGVSDEMLGSIRKRLSLTEQSLIFLNRRGYAPVLACQACSWLSECDQCSSYLVFHKTDFRLRCHHCGHSRPVPSACPDCGNIDLKPKGQGTQRLESFLKKNFPDARIVRVDRDTVQSIKKYNAVLKMIHDREVDIIIGTQMLVKGHHFPYLTFVGVIGADQVLFSPEYRACEQFLSQVIQVSGRCGRAELPGRVLIQTENIEHPVFKAITQHDYESFAKELLVERKDMGFPPYLYHCLLLADSRKLETVMSFLKDAQILAQKNSFEVTCYDPVSMRMSRLKSRERGQLLVECGDRHQLNRFLVRWKMNLEGLKKYSDLRWNFDVDPLGY